MKTNNKKKFYIIRSKTCFVLYKSSVSVNYVKKFLDGVFKKKTWEYMITADDKNVAVFMKFTKAPYINSEKLNLPVNGKEIEPYIDCSAKLDLCRYAIAKTNKNSNNMITNIYEKNLTESSPRRIRSKKCFIVYQNLTSVDHIKKFLHNIFLKKNQTWKYIIVADNKNIAVFLEFTKTPCTNLDRLKFLFDLKHIKPNFVDCSAGQKLYSYALAKTYNDFNNPNSILTNISGAEIKNYFADFQNYNAIEEDFVLKTFKKQSVNLPQKKNFRIRSKTCFIVYEKMASRERIENRLGSILKANLDWKYIISADDQNVLVFIEFRKPPGIFSNKFILKIDGEQIKPYIDCTAGRDLYMYALARVCRGFNDLNNFTTNIRRETLVKNNSGTIRSKKCFILYKNLTSIDCVKKFLHSVFIKKKQQTWQYIISTNYKHIAVFIEFKKTPCAHLDQLTLQVGDQQMKPIIACPAGRDFYMYASAKTCSDFNNPDNLITNINRAELKNYFVGLQNHDETKRNIALRNTYKTDSKTRRLNRLYNSILEYDYEMINSEEEFYDE